MLNKDKKTKLKMNDEELKILKESMQFLKKLDIYNKRNNNKITKNKNVA